MSREPQNPPYDKVRNIGQFKLPNDEKNHMTRFEILVRLHLQPSKLKNGPQTVKIQLI